MTAILLPITLTTAAVLAILCLALAFRCVMGRVKTNVMLGDGGNDDMLCRMRTLANFGEFVPLLLICLLMVSWRWAAVIALF